MNTLGQVFLVLCTILLFVNANTVNRVKYTPYQILVWEIKANEGYRSWWYPDGYNKGKRSYSIGFGWNDLGGRRRHEISNYTEDKKVTFNEAVEITVKELNKYGSLNKDPFKNIALQLYSYNCGLTTSGSKLGKCCGGSKGCGSSKYNVRKAHNARRDFELALWNHDMLAINRRTAANKQKIQTHIQILKSRGIYE